MSFIRRRNCPAPKRFWQKVWKTDTCWAWLGGTDSKGYGTFRVGDKTWSTHRFAWVDSGNELVAGLEINHLCHNRFCVNPAHLEQISHKDNIFYSPISIPSIHKAKTHCPKGHPYAGDNLWITSRNQRRCRACTLQGNRESNRRARKKQERSN